MRLRIMHRVSDDTRSAIAAAREHAEGGNWVASRLMHTHLDDLENHASTSPLLKEDILVAFLYQPRVRLQRRGPRETVPPIGRGTIVPDRLARRFVAAGVAFESALKIPVRMLGLAGLRPERLTDSEIEKLLIQDFGAKLRDDHLLIPDWKTARSRVYVSDRLHAAISVRGFPAQASFGGAVGVGLTTLPFEASVTLEVEHPSSSPPSGVSSANFMRLSTTDDSQAAGSERQISQHLAMALAGRQESFGSGMPLDSLDNALSALADTSVDLNTAITIVVSADEAGELGRRVEAVVGIVRGLGIENISITQDARMAASQIASAHPCGLRNELPLRVRSQEIASALPLYGRWRGFHRSAMLLRDILGRVVSYDPFPPELANRNTVVAGAAGSGKSFGVLITDVIPHAARSNAEIFLLDCSGSYRHVVEALEGVLVQPGARDRSLQINPFDFCVPVESLSVDVRERIRQWREYFAIEFLLDLLECREPRMRDAVTVAVHHLYAAGKLTRPRLRDFYEFLGHHSWPDQTWRQYALRACDTLRDYVVLLEGEEGAYAHIFDTDAVPRLENPVIGFDLQAVRPEFKLHRLAAATCLAAMGERMLLQDGRERLIVLDEIWPLIDGDDSWVSSRLARKIWEMAPAVRARCIAVTQSIHDLRENSARFLLEGSPSLRVLAHAGRVPDAASLRALGIHHPDVVSMFQIKPGHFSDMLVHHRGKASTVIRLSPPPLLYWVATSQPADLAELAQYRERYERERGLPLLAVLAILARDLPHGVVDSSRPVPMREAEALAYGTRFLNALRQA